MTASTQRPSVDFDGQDLNLQGLARIAELLDQYGDVRIIGVRVAGQHEQRPAETWLELMAEYRRPPNPAETRFRELAKAAGVEIFQWDEHALFMHHATSGFPTGRLCGWLIRRVDHSRHAMKQVKEKAIGCPLTEGGAFPTEGAVTYPCGCAMSVVNLDPAMENIDQIFTQALVALDLETKE